jgi:hypothetical protein
VSHPGASLAASNNAAWCDAVCRAHGLPTRSDADAWTCAERTPPWYPDAVTLRPDVRAETFLDCVDAGPGCSVKDSFATLDLAAHGFTILLEARWMVRLAHLPFTGRAERWRPVRDRSTFEEWELRWRGDDGPPGVLRTALLADATFAARADTEAIAAGAVLHRARGAVGVSNVFGVTDDDWPDLVAFAVATHPGIALVGYEAGDALAAARAAGFDDAGALRVWIRN